MSDLLAFKEGEEGNGNGVCQTSKSVGVMSAGAWTPSMNKNARPAARLELWNN